MKRLARLLPLLALAAVSCFAQDPATNAPLRVALCPYVPDPGAFEAALTNRWVSVYF